MLVPVDARARGSDEGFWCWSAQPALAANTAYHQLFNPSGSGKSLIVDRVRFYSTAATVAMMIVIRTSTAHFFS